MQDKNKKIKKQIKVQDLKPLKDAKGGNTRLNQTRQQGQTRYRPGNTNT
jgi:phage/plasmid primase-like uncharacterized protein